MKIHITSDVHLDFWIDAKHPQAKQIRLISEFIRTYNKLDLINLFVKRSKKYKVLIILRIIGGVEL